MIEWSNVQVRQPQLQTPHAHTDTRMPLHIMLFCFLMHARGGRSQSSRTGRAKNKKLKHHILVDSSGLKAAGLVQIYAEGASQN